MTAIDHPPGSPVFQALKERIEALGYRVEGHGVFVQVSTGPGGVANMQRQNGPILRAIPESPLDTQYEATGSTYYESLVMLAKQVGIELED